MKDLKRGPDAEIGLSRQDLGKGSEAAIKALDNFLFDQVINYGYGTVTVKETVYVEEDPEQDAPAVKIAYGDRWYAIETDNGREEHNHGDD